MPRGMSEDVSQVIVQALSRGLSRGQISGVVGVSKRAITRINTNLKKHGSPKAPPTGIKLGRPAKMTEEQAQAMLVWMAERDYTFYIKDLVAHLKDKYDYVGCDGTVRRALLKVGFRRKLPWHKSEVSIWLPPKNPRLGANNARAVSAATARTAASPSNEDDGDVDEENDRDDHDDDSVIDPSLEQATLTAPTQPQPSPLSQPSYPFQTFTPPPPPPQQLQPARASVRSSKDTAPKPKATPKPKSKAKPAARAPTEDVSELQQQLLDQRAQIERLQRLLEAQQQQQRPLVEPEMLGLQRAAVAAAGVGVYQSPYDEVVEEV